MDIKLKKVKLVGTSFSKNGSGVPERNEVFFSYISKEIPVEKIDIMDITKNMFKKLNTVLARNLTLLYIKSMIAGENIHVMHTVDLCNTLPLFNISNAARRKIITVDDFYPFIKTPDKSSSESFVSVLKRGCYRYLSTYDFIFARTKEIAESLTEKYGIDKGKIDVQGPIIEYSYSPIKNKIKNKKVRIGYINNFGWNKAPMLLYFIQKIREYKNEDIELVIYGPNFPYGQFIHNDKRIKYLGFLPDSELPKVLGSFDVYLSTSTYEGFGAPIAKAKAMKVPVLCYDGFLPEITKRNTCLWNRENLIEALENRCWEKVNLEAAYNDVLDLRPEKVIQQTLKVYERVF